MKRSKLFGRECFVDRFGESYIFGVGRYVRATPGRIIACITRSTFKLATPDFSERREEDQELPVSEAGLSAMLAHLGATRPCREQMTLKAFQDIKNANKKTNEINDVQGPFAKIRGGQATTPHGRGILA